jgi:hypothetical protein
MYRSLFFVAAILFSFAVPLGGASSAVAQSRGTVRMLCPESALNIGLYQKVIAEKVKTSIDPNAFSEVRVRVNLRRVGGETSVRNNSLDEILSGLSLANQGLTVLAGGALSFDFRCAHTYVVRIRVTATELQTGVRFSSSTDSRVIIDSAGEASFKRFR